MAAKSNDEEHLKQLHACFTSLNEDLKKWYTACVVQRCEVESRVQRCRKLLKPWPSDKKEESHKDEAGLQVAQENVSSEEPKSNPDLELLDKILEKAQRAREIQQKIDSSKSSGDSKKTQRPSTGQFTSKSDNAKTVQKTSIKSTQLEKETKAVAMTTKSLATGRPPSSKTVVKQPVLLRKNKAVPMKTTYGATYGRNVKRPGSVGRGQAVKPQSSSACSKVKSSAAHPESSSHDEEEPKIVERKEPVAMDDGKTQDIQQEDTDFVCRAKKELSRIEEDLKDTAARKQHLAKREELTMKSKNQTHQEQNKLEEGVASVEKAFLLSEEGHTLTLPSKYRKVKSSHIKLISKLIKGTRTNDQVDNNFVKRLESGFDFNEAPGHVIQDKVKTLEEDQRKLLAYLQWILDKKVDETQSFSWQNIYKAYRHWQVLLGKFRELQKGIQELLAGKWNWYLFSVQYSQFTICSLNVLLNLTN